MAETDPTLTRRDFLVLVARAFVIGVIAGLFTDVFLTVEHLLIEVIWGHELPYEVFDGGWKAFAVPVVAGLIVGVLYVILRLPSRLPGFIEDLEDGRVEPKTAPGAVLVALVSLVGGTSLGPEAPLATGVGGAATWWAERQGSDPAATRANNEAALSGVFGGLLSSPLIGGVLTVELEHHQTSQFTLRSVVPSLVAGVGGFLVVNPVLGETFLGRYEFEAFEVAPWYFAAAVVIGVLGAGVAIVMGLVGRGVAVVMSGLQRNTVVRGLVGGIVVGLIGFALPLTMFSGVDQLETAFENAASIGAGVLIVTVVAKMVTLAVSLNAGFYGGPFFPTFFIGGTVGAVAHLLVPELPLAIAVGAFMGATAGAVASIPLSIMLFAIYVVGLGPPAASIIGFATVIGFTSIQLVRLPTTTNTPTEPSPGGGDTDVSGSA